MQEIVLINGEERKANSYHDDGKRRVSVVTKSDDNIFFRQPEYEVTIGDDTFRAAIASIGNCGFRDVNNGPSSILVSLQEL